MVVIVVVIIIGVIVVVVVVDDDDDVPVALIEVGSPGNLGDKGILFL